MKKIVLHIINTLFLFALLAQSVVLAQQQIVIDSPEYQYVKENGTLDQYELVYPIDAIGTYDLSKPQDDVQTHNTKKRPDSGYAKSYGCDCYVVPDNTYTTLTHGDDAPNATLSLPFSFEFYGATYNTVYINNNGNITLDGTMPEYSSTGFFSKKVLSPFWADVHTGTNSNPVGNVSYKLDVDINGNRALYVNWHNVGYYTTFGANGSKRNSFQLIISDGNHVAIPEGNNVAFCYQQMEWTTGMVSCSGGTGQSCSYFGNSYNCSNGGGFCGIPATAGISKGQSQNGPHFLVGYFDHPGIDYDGIGGNNDGVGYLSYKSWYFKTSDGFNIAPVAQGVSACDTFNICTFNDTADVKIEFIAPEVNQTVEISYTDGGIIGGVEEILLQPGVAGGTAVLHLRIIGTMANVGTWQMSITATDSYDPPASTTIPFVVKVENIGSTLEPQINYTMKCNSFDITVSDANGVPYEGYLWDDLSTYPSTEITESGIHGVTIFGNNCHKRVEQYIHVPKPEPFNMKGELYLCPGNDITEITIGNASKMSSITWGPPAPYLIVNDATAQFQASTGNTSYKVSNKDSTGLCSNDTTFVIHLGQQSSILSNTTICNNLNYQVSGSTLGTNAYWSSPDPEISFSNIYANNPIITASEYGIYTVVVPSPCADTLITQLIYSGKPVLFPEDTICNGLSYTVDPPINTLGGKWTTSSTGLVSFSNDTIANPVISVLYPTFVSVTYTDKYCPTPFTSAILHFIEVNPSIPTYACDLSTSDIASNGYGSGLWSVVDDPNMGFSATESATFSPNNTENNPTLTVTQPGIYTVQYIDSFCNKITERQIYFHPELSKILSDTMLCAGEPHIFNAQQNNMPTSYLWNTGETTASITTTKGGYHTVEISNDCFSIIDSAYIDQMMCDINAPNVLSLSSTSGNNTWKLLDNNGIESYNCIIVNRWGTLVFETNDVNSSWNGTDNKGNSVSEGVYFYTIHATAIGGLQIEKHGFITLVH